MKHIPSTTLLRRAAGLLAAVTILMISAGLAHAAAPNTTPLDRVYLPLVRNAGSATTPPPASQVRMVLDQPRATHGPIGPTGATLRATAADGTQFELVVPPNALDFTETITMTPASTVENLPLSGGLAGAVSLEPAGLTFYEPATLTVTPASAPSGPIAIGFAFDDTGQEFHLRPVSGAIGMTTQANETQITMEIISIRPYGAGRGSQADIDRQLSQTPPDDPLDALEQQLADQKALNEGPLEIIYKNVLLPALQRAETDDRLADQAIMRFDEWFGWVDTFGLRPHFITQLAEGKTEIQRILAHASSVAADRCYSQKRPEEGFRLLRWLRYARKYLSSADIAAIEARLAKCLKFELTFHSIITEGLPGSGYGYSYELRAQTTLRAAQSTRATGSGSLDWVDFHWIGGGPCTFATQGESSTFDAASAGFGFSMAPVSRTSPAVKLALRYNPGVPYENTTMSCPGGKPVVWHTNGWSSYFTKMHEYERDGTAFRASAQIVNAGSFTGWVYHHTTSGPGGQAVVEDTQIDITHVPER